MQTDDLVRGAKALVEVVGEHRLGPVDRLLRRLADEHQSSMPLGLRRRHRPGNANQHRYMNVVAAGVHHASLLPSGGMGHHVRGIKHARLFNDG